VRRSGSEACTDRLGYTGLERPYAWRKHIVARGWRLRKIGESVRNDPKVAASIGKGVRFPDMKSNGRYAGIGVSRFGRFLGNALVASAMICGAAPTNKAFAQSQSSAEAPKFEYEVASIKPAKPGPASGGFRIGIMNAPDGFTASNVNLEMLLSTAYGVQNFQIMGTPDWGKSERYDIDAKMDEATAEALKKMSQDDRNAARQKMLQALLAERFGLTIHRDTKELPIYTLIVGKNGPKITESKPEAADPNATPSGSSASKTPDGRGGATIAGRGGPGMIMSFGRGGAGVMSMSANGVPISNLVRSLSGQLGRPVYDKTGLTGNYDFKLEWSRDDSVSLPSHDGGGGDGPAPAAPPDASGPSLMTAVQEQLGLKLESGKGPVEIIVLDHVEKPSNN
jgi:bla regulator protein blaR1